MACAIFILFITIFSFLSPSSVAYAQNDTLKQGQLLRDYEQLISAGGVFRLGFFSPNPNVGLIGTAGARVNDVYDFKFVANGEERYFSYSIKERSILSRWDLDTLGEVTVLTVDKRDGHSGWRFETSGACNYDFKNSTSVCLTEKPIKCRNGTESFVPKRGYIDLSQSWYDSDTSLALSDCHARCWKNCTCDAYQALNPSDGIGCQFWSNVSSFTPSDNLEFVYLLTNESNEGRTV
ncbi:unnamed protein product [Dovyalis caffra]|uniref:Apple domain-containing protein n=1 Tax=Dovyalis caffra TaxID=77055 RepID=A0AAV1RZZ2_9ROSI|nr:unnamed protein product [Dovyalis caffra]